MKSVKTSKIKHVKIISEVISWSSAVVRRGSKDRGACPLRSKQQAVLVPLVLLVSSYLVYIERLSA